MAPSIVWNYFEKICNNTKVKCNKCGKELAFNKSTTSLANHLKTAHKILVKLQPPTSAQKQQQATATISDTDEEGVDDPQVPVQKEKEVRSARIPDASPNRSTPASSNSAAGGPMDRCLNNFSSFSSGGSRDVACTNMLVYMLAVDNMPLSLTERKGFRLFCKTLQPLYHLPSEPTVTKRMKQKYEELKQVVAKKLEEAESVCLTADIWTHKSTMRSYLGVTGHFRDGNDLVAIELCCMQLTDRKNIPNLRKALSEVCSEWNLTYDRISAVVTDGGANIKGAVREEFGPLKHVTCIGHLINGIGQSVIGLHKYEVQSMRDNPEELPEDEDDLDNADEFNEAIDGGVSISLKDCIKKVKKVVRFFRQSEIANSELIKLQMEEQGKKEHECLRLIQEVRTRWNSCYDMLQRFLQLDDLVSRVLRKIQRDKSSYAKPPPYPSVDELEALTEARDLLKPLHQITQEVSKEKSVTLSKCIPLVKTLKAKIEQFEAVTPIGFNLKADLLREISAKFSGIELLRPYAAATLLDPRFKREGFSAASSQGATAAVANAISYVSQQVAAEIDRSAVQLQRTMEQEAQREREPAEEEGFWADFDTTVRSRAPLAGQDMAGGLPIEFRQYLNSNPINRKENPNPLAVWQLMKGEFPHVYKVAMRHLTVMATSVPSERLFSHAGLIATQLRNRLSGKHLDQLVFLRSVPEYMWLT